VCGHDCNSLTSGSRTPRAAFGYQRRPPLHEAEASPQPFPQPLCPVREEVAERSSPRAAFGYQRRPPLHEAEASPQPFPQPLCPVREEVAERSSPRAAFGYQRRPPLHEAEASLQPFPQPLCPVREEVAERSSLCQCQGQRVEVPTAPWWPVTDLGFRCRGLNTFFYF
jgi:hypothetical protein